MRPLIACLFVVLALSASTAAAQCPGGCLLQRAVEIPKAAAKAALVTGEKAIQVATAPVRHVAKGVHARREARRARRGC
jgi:hypothetical protein